MSAEARKDSPLFGADVADLLFRVFFCSIFVVLGLEHIFHDELIQRLMPDWFPARRALSLASGMVLLTGASFILLGYKSRFGALILGAFLVSVTLLVHVPAVAGVGAPVGLPAEWRWLWDLFQRSNLVKNLCLLGVCSHLYHHRVGRLSLDAYLAARGRR